MKCEHAMLTRSSLSALTRTSRAKGSRRHPGHPQHPTVSKTYEHLSSKEEGKIKFRKDAALLAQLRSGHCKELKAYQHRLDETKDEICPRCQLEAETVQHWLACPANIRKRQDIFGDDDVPLGMMTKNPGLILAYARETSFC